MKEKEILAKYNRPENFFNRDLSWIEFNRRVLDEACNPHLPLLERVKFISIFSSNLDEFYMIRVSGIKEQIAAGINELTIDGLTPMQQLLRIESAVQPMLEQVSDLWLNTLLPGLKENGVHVCRYPELSDEERSILEEYFKNEIFPVLTPLAVDPSRPFPYISNLSLNLAVSIRSPKGENRFARVKVPNSLPRLIHLDSLVKSSKRNGNGMKHKFAWLGDIIGENLHLLFPKMEILEYYRFRVTRDTDIEIQEDEADDLLETIEENIRRRKFGNVVRLEVEKRMSSTVLKMLTEHLELTQNDIHIIGGPLGLPNVMQLYDLPLPRLKEKSFHPPLPRLWEDEENLFITLKKRDILLHHPYDSFSTVVDFIKNASRDPDVLAIKQTLYRVGPKSPIVEALIEAAERNKQVAVLVELKARFDEENNIFWARELEKAGVHVVYGLVGLKTHAKITLVVRKENEKLHRYVHLSTGNYNPGTARIYTDIGMFTSDPEICSDVSDIFNFLTGFSEQTEFKKLIVAPIGLRKKVLELVFREIENAKAGKKARIVIKINSLVDPVCISALYEASKYGVQVQLIIRGICCLVPGVKDLSENITVVSIVGRFLEHSRIFYFYNNGDEEVFISSADLMQRNLDRRVELLTPVESPKLRDYIIKTIIPVYLKDNEKTRILNPDMTYSPVPKRESAPSFNAQETFMRNALKLVVH